MWDRKRLYWDACCFLYYLNGTAGKVEHLERLLDKASNKNEIIIFTSHLSVVEVAYASHEMVGGNLPPEIDESIEALWQDTNAIEVIEVNDEITYTARDLIRWSINQGFKALRSVDAIHIATAIYSQVAELNSYEAKFKRYEPYLDFPVREPAAEQPSLSGLEGTSRGTRE